MNVFDIELSDRDLWLLVAAGACIAWLVPHWLAGTRDRKNAMRQPIADFKAAFAEEIAAFREDGTTFCTLADAFDKHHEAVKKIMPLLCDNDQRHLQHAWDEYCSIASGFEPEQKARAIAGYSHPDMYATGKRRFAAVHSCLNHLA